MEILTTCGAGFIGSRLAEMLEKKNGVIVLDHLDSYYDAKGLLVARIAVQKGNEWLKQEGISNVKLLVSRADELKQFPDKRFDVVFAGAVLLYVGPDKIGQVMKEMSRITRTKLLLLEYFNEDMDKNSQGLGIYCGCYWKRDYVALLKQFIPNFPEDRIHISKFPEDLWSPAEGGGTLIEFDMTLEEWGVVD